MSDGISETVDLALVRVAVLDFEERAAGLLDGETVAAEAGDFTRAAGLLRAVLAAYESAVRERETVAGRARAALLAAVRAKVEGMDGIVIEGEETRLNNVTIRAYRTVLQDAISRTRVLAALDTLPEDA